jgi:hypothetical protein
MLLSGGLCCTVALPTNGTKDFRKAGLEKPVRILTHAFPILLSNARLCLLLRQRLNHSLIRFGFVNSTNMDVHPSARAILHDVKIGVRAANLTRDYAKPVPHNAMPLSGRGGARATLDRK